MQKLFILFSIIFLFSACKNNTENVENTTENGLKSKTPSLIEPALLDRANINMTTIDAEAFGSIPSSAEKVANALCEKSKGYKANTWEGLNDCSWVFEKEQILKYKDLVSRNEQQLSIKTKLGEKNFINKADSSASSPLFQFKDYLPASQYFIIEEHVEGNCPMTRILKEADGTTYLLKGTVAPAPGGTHLLNYSAKSKENIRCNNQLESYSISTEGLKKNWHLSLKDKVIKEVKYIKDNEVYISLLTGNNGKDDINYLRLSW